MAGETAVRVVATAHDGAVPTKSIQAVHYLGRGGASVRGIGRYWETRRCERRPVRGAVRLTSA